MVLVCGIGGGPVGLCAAAQLHRFGIPFRIFDRNDKYLTTAAVQVQRNTEVTGVSPQDNGVLLHVKNVKTDEEEEVFADWVIGSDGGHSLCRHTLKLPFEA
eukprot:TRINITY_DN67720_c3_g6_i1.p1 TRINITY_DN67720_c3_g6~~TRINITY_DN67720_c3_g6_i1.p1  ORF type:complete len:101 (+),score=10.27 TRINITY_DN67720_c3_g6_i1:88-390(+)